LIRARLDLLDRARIKIDEIVNLQRRISDEIERLTKKLATAAAAFEALDDGHDAATAADMELARTEMASCAEKYLRKRAEVSSCARCPIRMRYALDCKRCIGEPRTRRAEPETKLLLYDGERWTPKRSLLIDLILSLRCWFWCLFGVYWSPNLSPQQRQGRNERK